MTAEAELALRDGTADDAVALAAFAERSFRSAFGADNTPDDMEAYVAEAFSIERVRAELADPNSVVLLAHDASLALRGYCRLLLDAPCAAADAARPIELVRLYVDPEGIGTGVGAMLMSEALARAHVAGGDLIWLGVWERNARAIAFYERWGFSAIGRQIFLLGSDPQRDLLMVRRLAR